MCPVGGSLLGGEGGIASRAEMCAHVLLIESSDSLVLVDTGFGLDQARETKRHMPALFRAAVQPRMTESQTALRQVEALGFDPADVRHIVPTHLDIDHAGGLPDFPRAQVHVWRPEMEAVQSPRLKERPRYMKHLFAHGPQWAPHDTDGDEWMGFESVRALPGVDPTILIVPLPGHTRGHSIVAVESGDGWLVHCGDAYFHRNQVDTPPSCPPGLRAFQAIVGLERGRRLANEERLRELNEREQGNVRLFCAHDPVELHRLQTT